jgi:hypothetical protein
MQSTSPADSLQPAQAGSLREIPSYAERSAVQSLSATKETLESALVHCAAGSATALMTC